MLAMCCSYNCLIADNSSWKLLHKIFWDKRPWVILEIHRNWYIASQILLKLPWKFKSSEMRKEIALGWMKTRFLDSRNDISPYSVKVSKHFSDIHHSHDYISYLLKEKFSIKLFRWHSWVKKYFWWNWSFHGERIFRILLLLRLSVQRTFH